MRYVWMSLVLELRGTLRRWKAWAFLLLLLLGIVAVRQASEEEEAGIVTVGVVLPETGGERFWARLTSRENQMIRFCLTDEETLRQKVSVSRWDCGLILRSDFEDRLEAGKFEKLITLITGPGSTVYPLVRETTAAVLLELSAPEIAEDYLRDRSLAEEAALEALRPCLETLLPKDRRVEVTMETLDGTELEPVALAEKGTSRIFLGLTAVLLLVWTLSAAVDLGRWQESAQAERLLALQGPAAVLLPRLLGNLIPPFLFTAVGMLLLDRAWRAAAMLLPYLLALGALALLLARGRRCWRILPVLLPFAAAAGVLLSPVFLDAALLVPTLEPVMELMPVTLYLEGWSGDGTAPVKLLGMALLFGWLAVGRKYKRRDVPAAF